MARRRQQGSVMGDLDSRERERQSEGARLPYEKPAIAWEEGLDTRPTLIAGCGKVEMSEASCLATGPGS